ARGNGPAGSRGGCHARRRHGDRGRPMTVQRGDIVLARVPHLAGTRGKKRPAVVIQADTYNATLNHVVVAEVTSNPRWVADPACLFIDISTPEGQATGLHQDGVVSCLHLVTMNADRLGI